MTENKEKPKIEKTVKCSDCGGTYLGRDRYRAELVCKNCGLVIDEDFIDYGPK